MDYTKSVCQERLLSVDIKKLDINLLCEQIIELRAYGQNPGQA